jgi:histidinol-phosphate aminotransferase
MDAEWAHSDVLPVRDFPVRPRVEVEGLKACVHGAIGDEELRASGLTLDRVADFSVNSHPLGPAPGVLTALSTVDATRYPDDSAAELRRALAARLGIGADRLIVGNGSAELIWLVALAYVRPGDVCAVFGPTFGEYARAIRLMGGQVRCHTARAEASFAVGLDSAVPWLAWLRPRLLVLCNPNNPTGTYLPLTQVERLMRAAPNALVMVDEAYVAFVPRAQQWRVSAPRATPADPDPAAEAALLPLTESGRVVLLRSMTKDHALAGLRLGYAVSHPTVVETLMRVRPPWSVNAAAQAAGLAALADDTHQAQARRAAAEAIDFLSAALQELGWTTFPTRANFVLVEVGDAARIRQALLRVGLVVRDCTSFGLPSMIRLGARSLPDCRRLVTAMAGLTERAT